MVMEVTVIATVVSPVVATIEVGSTGVYVMAVRTFGHLCTTQASMHSHMHTSVITKVRLSVYMTADLV